MLKLDVDLKFHNQNNHERIEMFYFRNRLCQERFKEKTTYTKMFTQCFESNESIEIQFQRWKRRLLKAFHASFQKIRVKNNDKKKLSDIDILLNKKKSILKKKNLDKSDK